MGIEGGRLMSGMAIWSILQSNAGQGRQGRADTGHASSGEIEQRSRGGFAVVCWAASILVL